jgi:mono/diheme cytochrome c family protein
MMKPMAGRLALAVAALTLCGACAAEEPQVVTPDVDVSALPPLGGEWRAFNPYRGNGAAMETGQAIYAQTCLACHGPAERGNHAHVGPNLMRIDRYCRKLAPGAMKDACLADVDHYFLTTVRKGKVILDVRHMPAWEGVLTQEMMWAVRSYLQSR